MTNTLGKLALIFLIAHSWSSVQLPIVAANQLPATYTLVKTAGFLDPNIGYVNRVNAFNASAISAGSTHRSVIKVDRIKIDANRMPISEPEHIQTLTFHPTLVDFDVLCAPTYCYLVVVTSQTRKNIHLFSWQRTQFDLQTRRDSYARPYGVRLFRIQSSFYIAVAQEQMHLFPNRLSLDYEEPSRFVGSAILKFSKGKEKDMKYHQFIRLGFNPTHVEHITSVNEFNLNPITKARVHENHYIVFSSTSISPTATLSHAHAFLWSPLNDYFWPFRLPSNAQLEKLPGHRHQILRFPSPLDQVNISKTAIPTRHIDYNEPVEICFNQLQRLLVDRDLQARKLIQSSQSLWRSVGSRPTTSDDVAKNLADINARVIVNGNVIVRGSVIESPQITLVGKQTVPSGARQLSGLIDIHSPALVESKIKQAFYKLKYIRDKLSRSITANYMPTGPAVFNSNIRFFGNIQANRVIFRGRGIANSNVRINGIPFKQLEHELVSLVGSQEIGAKVIFRGDVMADTLEIHGQVNRAYFMRDAVDVTSKFVQVIEPSFGLPGSPGLEFFSVNTRDLILSHNATFNSIQLSDFITRDPRPQVVVGRKSFNSLHLGQLQLDNVHVPINGFNISRLASNTIRLQGPSFQTISSNHVTFTRPIYVGKLIVNSFVNQHINVSALIHDSVKTSDIGLQQIFGFKNFLSPLRINHLTTEGSINGVQVHQIFNLNPTPPLPDYHRYFNSSAPLPVAPVTGNYFFDSRVTVRGNVIANLVNDVDIERQAVRRGPRGSIGPLQVVFGNKIFFRPVRITKAVELVDPREPAPQFAGLNRSLIYPLINGLDLKHISNTINGLMRNPPVINVDTLEIEGNLNLRTSNYGTNQSGAATLGRYAECPLDIFKSNVVLHGSEEQSITVPIQVGHLRARSVIMEPRGFNLLSFPDDFVLRSNPSVPAFGPTAPLESIYGHKTFDHLVISFPKYAPSFESGLDPAPRLAYNSPGVVFGSDSSINRIAYSEIQTFIDNERERNSTGETVIQALRVYGNIYARRINGHHWPDDIILKSVGTSVGRYPPNADVHRRIYSPLIFADSSRLEVAGQLVLRGPIQLNGRLNGVNLTEFSAQSVTYGDKDLLSIRRPLRNKIFAGGITVTGEFRSQGLIDGVSFDEMKQRVVTVTAKPGQRVHLLAAKSFLSDVTFTAPINMMYLNDLAVGQHLSRIMFYDDPTGHGKFIQVFGKKTVTGALRINKSLYVIGLVNGINFVELQARAISLAPLIDSLKFNKTLTIEGNVYMDNLIIDENNGVIDGVRLTNLLPIESVGKNELVITAPLVTRQNLTSQPGYQLNVTGLIHDCHISCSLQRPQVLSQPIKPTLHQALLPTQVYDLSPSAPPSQQFAPILPRSIQYMGKNVTSMKTTPPYTIPMPAYTSPPPIRSHKRAADLVSIDQRLALRNLALRRPTSIEFEFRQPKLSRVELPTSQSFLVQSQLSTLRQQIVSINIISSVSTSGYVLGFIESGSHDTRSLILPEQGDPHAGHYIAQESFLQLDQVDFRFVPTSPFHLSVGVSTLPSRANVTVVNMAVGGGPFQQLSVLPVDSPNSALFLESTNKHANLFLLISQDLRTTIGTSASPLCPHKPQVNPTYPSITYPSVSNAINGVHVYLFYALQNSSHLDSAYFDLYQTIDLPGIDGFDSFTYRESSYVLAISRVFGRIHLLILRGYSGFQIVSSVDVPELENARVVYTADGRPAIIIALTSGYYKVLESVIV